MQQMITKHAPPKNWIFTHLFSTIFFPFFFQWKKLKQAPIEAAPWFGTLDATKTPKICIQLPEGSQITGGDEDCLTLNIYTPKVSNFCEFGEVHTRISKKKKSNWRIMSHFFP